MFENIGTEYSKNKTITQYWLFENEIGPVVLQSSVHEHVPCKNTRGTKRRPLTCGTGTDSVLVVEKKF